MQQKGNTIYQKKMGGAALFALAILVLIVSCPLKRLLANNSPSQSLITAKSNQANSAKQLSIFSNENTICTSGIHEVTVLQAGKTDPTKSVTPVFAVNIFYHTGYFIHSFLDRTRANANIAPASAYASLSLFLQHRRLLI